MPAGSEDRAEEFAAAVEDTSAELSGPGASWFDRVVDTGLVLSGLVIAMIALAVTFNVLSRQFLGRSYTWAFEYAEIGMLFMVFLAVAGVARSDGHVRMEIVDELLPARQLRRVVVTSELISALVALTLCVVGAWITYRNLVAGTTLGLLNTPRWMVLAIVPLGSAAMFVVQVARTLRRVRQRDASADGDVSGR